MGKSAFSGQGNDFMRSKLVHENTLATESWVKLNPENNVIYQVLEYFLQRSDWSRMKRGRG